MMIFLILASFVLWFKALGVQCSHSSGRGLWKSNFVNCLGNELLDSWSTGLLCSALTNSVQRPHFSPPTLSLDSKATIQYLPADTTLTTFIVLFIHSDPFPSFLALGMDQTGRATQCCPHIMTKIKKFLKTQKTHKGQLFQQSKLH